MSHFRPRFSPIHPGFAGARRSRALAFGCALGALYAMLYALLKAEDYSLLGGALLLFGLLAAVMLATRRVDWYGADPRDMRRVTRADSAPTPEPAL